MDDNYRLADIIDIYISGDWGEEHPSSDANCPVSCIRGADIVPIGNSRYENIPVRYITNSSLQNKLLREGDIVIEKSGGSPTQSTGRTVFISKALIDAKKNLVCSNFCQGFRVKDGWNPLYVYYFLQLVYDSGVFFNFEGKTSGIKNLLLDSAFHSITIRRLSFEEQCYIADTISRIEKKIAINYAINDTIEAATRQLYEYWFVQYNFPDENEKPYMHSGGKMRWDDNVKRNIPKGWTTCPVGDILDKYPSTKRYETVEYLKQGDYPIIDQGDKYIVGFTNETIGLLNKGPAVVFGDHSTRVKYVELPFARGADGTQILYSNHPNILPRYLYLSISSIPIPNPGYSRHFKYLKELPIVIPDKQVAKRFEELVAPLFSRWTYSVINNYSLIRLRDSLLPLLLNGQVAKSNLPM